MAEETTSQVSHSPPSVEVMDSTTTIQLFRASSVEKLHSTTTLSNIGLTQQQQKNLQQALNHSINSTSNSYHHNNYHQTMNSINSNNNNNNDHCIINKNSHNRERKFNEFIESCSVKTMNQCKRSKFCDSELFMSTSTFGQQQQQQQQQSKIMRPTILKSDENGDRSISLSSSTTTTPSPPTIAEMKSTTTGFLRFCRYPESCLTLQDILKSFNAPISEEQAWALIFQTTKLYKNAWLMDTFNRRELRSTENIEYLSVHTDGTVHLNWNLKDEDHNDGTIITQRKILMKLAIIVYQAMDFNLPADETCLITSELEQLISQMATEDADENEDCIHCTDEGIDEDDKLWEDESEDGKSIDTKELDFVLEACASRCKPSVPEDHYKAVCRALVTEALELRIFLQKVFTGDTVALRIKAETQTSEQELDKLGFSDWARFWIQVVDELRRGVRLKKRDSSRMPVEFELTPYEILMDDIRQRKYNLRKVMVNGDIPPRVKKDAHALILEFIRSRPPLKKASERKLPPPIKRTPSPREQLMDSIRQGQQLKPIQPCLKNHLLPPTSQQVEAIKKEDQSETHPSPRSKQRLIKVDFSLLQDDDEFFYDNLPASGSTSLASNNSSTSYCSQTKMPPYPMGYNNENNPNKINTVLRRTTYDLATQCESRRASMRRHTIVGCQSNFSETVSMPPSRPESRQSEMNTSIDTTQTDDQLISNTPSTSIKQPQPHHHQAHNNLNKPNGSSNLSSIDTEWTKASIDDKQQWSERICDRLSLTLEEIVHIRSVMTKAELEGLPVGIRVKEDVERRKVCFLCLRTRFSIFGPWGIQCKLCQRTVCSKCYSKMRIPTEHFRNVPVVLLSPSLMSSPAGSSTPSPSHQAYNSHTTSSASSILDESFPKSLMDRLLRSESTRQTRNTVGSAPSSPKHQRSNIPTPANAAALANQQMAKSMLATTIAGNSLHSSNKENLLNGSSAINKNVSLMSRSMEGPRSLPVHSPARPHSNSSTLDRKSKFTRAFTLSSSGHLGDQKENLRGELMAVCNDCRCLVLEIIRSSKQTRSSARNRALKNLTLDLSPVYKPF